MGERFIVRETRGYSMASGGSGSHGRATSSFAVLDRAMCHREVAPGRFYAVPFGSDGDEDRRRNAEAFAAELNEWDRGTRCA